MDIYLQPGDTLTGVVPKRPVVVAPNFGKWLQLRRGDDRSLEQIAKRVRPLVKAAGLKVDQSLIFKIEQGRVPNWPILMALASVYDISTEEMARRLAEAIEFPGRRDLPDHGDPRSSVAAQSQLQQGGPIDPASPAAQARVLSVATDLIEIAESFRRAVQNATGRLSGDVARAPDVDATGTLGK